MSARGRDDDAAKKRSSLVGPLIVVGALCLATWSLTARYYVTRINEVNGLSAGGVAVFTELRDKYRTRVTRGPEEWIIRDFFQDRREGVFVDVGANHYRDENNTYYLETALNWSGIAIEAQPQFGPDWAQHRPRSRFVAMFAADSDGTTIPFFVPTNRTENLVASSSESLPASLGLTVSKTDVPTATLNTLLAQAGIANIDFLTMDIELSEPKALAGLDIDRFAPSLVCIEAHDSVRQQILDYFQSHGYVVISRYLRADVMNLYFKPARTAASLH